VAIKGFRHKGLERFFATGAKAGIQAKHAQRLRLILGRLNASTSERDMNLPGLDLHELRGARKGTWAVKVSGNLARHVHLRRQGHGSRGLRGLPLR
jgi:proteic killer suppression protein